MHSTLTSKGQITLPKALRERLNLSAGDRIEFVLDEDSNVRLVIKPSSLHRLKGMLPEPQNPVSLQEMDRAIEEGGQRE
ncbi:MAG: AbrB/MazE/SpoVT family DNA-binding domain-containing protein [Desulfohalobiaceae bacterium]|nr:AbrB/MazE/SpoVT family DNA-binding domain-containing protein [Desulfohalobiaceae bacterium]